MTMVNPGLKGLNRHRDNKGRMSHFAKWQIRPLITYRWGKCCHRYLSADKFEGIISDFVQLIKQ